MGTERTLSIIKPDGLEKGVVGKIVARFEESGLKPVAMRMQWLSQKEAEGFYAVHKARPFFLKSVKSCRIEARAILPTLRAVV